jgi:hypothetical protein
MQRIRPTRREYRLFRCGTTVNRLALNFNAIRLQSLFLPLFSGEFRKGSLMDEMVLGYHFSGHAEFTTTHWSLILAAGQQTNAARASEALESLCRIYWYPLYAYIRRLIGR